MKPRKNYRPNRATRKFQDREQPRKVFWEEYKTISNEMANQDSNIHIVSYYGIGGIGKTRLIRKIVEEMTEKDVNYAVYDFENGQDLINVLQTISKELEKQKYAFPLFEYARYLYKKKLGEYAEAYEASSFLEKNLVVASVKKTLDLVPVVSDFLKVVELADDIQSKIRTYIHNNQERFKSLYYLSAKELYDELPNLFAEDLENAIAKTGKPLVILFDTYEKNVNVLSQTGVAHSNDEWLRDNIIARVPNVLWVICGREYLDWEQYNIEWKEAINSHLLGNLSLKDTEEFLGSEGITDVKLCKDLYHLTKGTPLYLDICVETYLCFKAQNQEQIPTIENFGENTNELVERFIKYMDYNIQEMVYSLICLESWTDALIEEVGYDMCQNFNFVLYEKIKKLSFVICENDRYYVHKTVGDILLPKIPVQIKNKVGNIIEKKYFPEFDKLESWAYGDCCTVALPYIARAAVLKALNDDLNDDIEFSKVYTKIVYYLSMTPKWMVELKELMRGLESLFLYTEKTKNINHHMQGELLKAMLIDMYV